MAWHNSELQKWLFGEVPGMGGVANIHVTFMEQPARTANW
jgi:hypothetical protein